MNSFKLKNLESIRSVFVHTIIEEEEEGVEGSQRWFGRTKGSSSPPWIPSILLFSVWIVDVVHMFGGEISKEFAIGDVRDLPTLILVSRRTCQAMNKNAKVKHHIHEAKLCIRSAWFLVHLSSYRTKERYVGVGIMYVGPCFFSFLQKVSGQ
jgi:hypothetical protein